MYDSLSWSWKMMWWVNKEEYEHKLSDGPCNFQALQFLSTSIKIILREEADKKARKALHKAKAKPCIRIWISTKIIPPIWVLVPYVSNSEIRKQNLDQVMFHWTIFFIMIYFYCRDISYLFGSLCHFLFLVNNDWIREKSFWMKLLKCKQFYLIYNFACLKWWVSKMISWAFCFMKKISSLKHLC